MSDHLIIEETSFPSIEDLQAWLRKDLSVSLLDDLSNDTTETINTRTFERPKKNGKMSFESIIEITLPTSNSVRHVINIIVIIKWSTTS